MAERNCDTYSQYGKEKRRYKKEEGEVGNPRWGVRKRRWYGPVVTVSTPTRTLLLIRRVSVTDLWCALRRPFRQSLYASLDRSIPKTLSGVHFDGRLLQTIVFRPKGAPPHRNLGVS